MGKFFFYNKIKSLLLTIFVLSFFPCPNGEAQYHFNATIVFSSCMRKWYQASGKLQLLFPLSGYTLSCGPRGQEGS